MQSIELLAAGVDGVNVSPDGCHTQVVKEFLGGGLLMRNLPDLRAEPDHGIHVETKT